MGQCPSNISSHDTRMIEEVLELRRWQASFADVQVCQAADVSGIKTVERCGVSQIILDRGPQDFDGCSGIVLIQFHRSPERRQAVILDHSIQWSVLTYSIC